MSHTHRPFLIFWVIASRARAHVIPGLTSQVSAPLPLTHAFGGSFCKEKGRPECHYSVRSLPSMSSKIPTVVPTSGEEDAVRDDSTSTGLSFWAGEEADSDANADTGAQHTAKKGSGTAVGVTGLVLPFKRYRVKHTRHVEDEIRPACMYILESKSGSHNDFQAVSAQCVCTYLLSSVHFKIGGEKKISLWITLPAFPFPRHSPPRPVPLSCLVFERSFSLRARLSASPATGLAGLLENELLGDFFGCLGFLSLATERFVPYVDAIFCDRGGIASAK